MDTSGASNENDPPSHLGRSNENQELGGNPTQYNDQNRPCTPKENQEPNARPATGNDEERLGASMDNQECDGNSMTENDGNRTHVLTGTQISDTAPKISNVQDPEKTSVENQESGRVSMTRNNSNQSNISTESRKSKRKRISTDRNDQEQPSTSSDTRDAKIKRNGVTKENNSSDPSTTGAEHHYLSEDLPMSTDQDRSGTSVKDQNSDKAQKIDTDCGRDGMLMGNQESDVPNASRGLMAEDGKGLSEIPEGRQESERKGKRKAKSVHFLDRPPPSDPNGPYMSGALMTEDERQESIETTEDCVRDRYISVTELKYVHFSQMQEHRPY